MVAGHFPNQAIGMCVRRSVRYDMPRDKYTYFAIDEHVNWSRVLGAEHPWSVSCTGDYQKTFVTQTIGREDNICHQVSRISGMFFSCPLVTVAHCRKLYCSTAVSVLSELNASLHATAGSRFHLKLGDATKSATPSLPNIHLHQYQT